MSVIAQEDDSYRAHVGEEPWLAAPRSTWAQTRMALLERIYLPERMSPVHPEVAKIRDEAELQVDAAVASQTTDGARIAAFELVDIIRAHAAALR